MVSIPSPPAQEQNKNTITKQQQQQQQQQQSWPKYVSKLPAGGRFNKKLK